MTLTPKNVVVWYGKTPAEHKALADKWADKKFRTLSLSLYGSRMHPLYAAVMVKRPKLIAGSQVGPVDQAGMQKAFDDNVKIGRGPYILTATGPASEPIFAGCNHQNPGLSGADALMDPWSYTEADTRNIASLGYTYV